MRIRIPFLKRFLAFVQESSGASNPVTYLTPTFKHPQAPFSHPPATEPRKGGDSPDESVPRQVPSVHDDLHARTDSECTTHVSGAEASKSTDLVQSAFATPPADNYTTAANSVLETWDSDGPQSEPITVIVNTASTDVHQLGLRENPVSNIQPLGAATGTTMSPERSSPQPKEASQDELIGPGMHRGETEEQDVEGTLILLLDLMELVRGNSEMDCLQTAVFSLQGALEKLTGDEQHRVAALFHLIVALLTRYGLCGWVEDIDSCARHFTELGIDDIFKFAEQGFDESIQAAELDVAAQLTQACQNSLDIDTLNTIIRITTETLKPDSDISNRQSAHLLIILGSALVMRCLFHASTADLDQACTAYQQVLCLCRDGDPFIFICHMSLSHIKWLHFITFRKIRELTSTRHCFQRAEAADGGKVLQDIGAEMVQNAIDDIQMQNGIALLKASVNHRMRPHPRRLSSLCALADAHFARFMQIGCLEDLDECIVLYCEAQEICPAHHPDHPAMMNNLGNYLSTRFHQKGMLQDLDKSISLHRKVLNLRPSPHPDRGGTLSNLAAALCLRFSRTGAYQDLDEGIILQGEALYSCPIPHPDRVGLLGNLAHNVLARFMQKGVFQDLQESIMLSREALNVCSMADRHKWLHDLAYALCMRFEEKSALKDLEESVLLSREALKLVPKLHPNYPASLSQLASVLFIRYTKDETIQDLHECITLYQEAMDLLPATHPGHSGLLSSFASVLLARFTLEGTIQDLGRSITLYQEALDSHPRPHPGRLRCLNSLANALCIRFVQKGESQDIEAGLQLFEEAVEYDKGSLLNRLKCSQRWVFYVTKHRPALSLHVYTCTMKLLPQLVSVDLTLSQRQDVLEYTRGLVVEAAKCAIDADQFELAVTFLSTGRAVFWSQALQLRTPVDALSATSPSVAERFIQISTQLEQASYSNQSLVSMSLTAVRAPSDITPSITSSYTLADQHRQIIEEIRSIPEFEKFLLPPSFSMLQGAAKGGPVVILSGCGCGCDALILSETGPPMRVPLPDINDTELKEIKALLDMPFKLGTGIINTFQGMVGNFQRLLGRDMDRKYESEPTDSTEYIFQLALGYLWIGAIHPVIKALGFRKTDSLRRVWWCPTGSFATLPIHAAGIYTENSQPVDCLFQYVISSYCVSPQDLLHPVPQTTTEFKMMAIIEPEAPGAATLPATREELRRIAQHVPNSRNLVTRVGSKEAPTHIVDLTSDLKQSTIVHFGCHGMQNLNNPLESYLLLSGGKLTMGHIIKQCKVPEGALAYLSACETAKGDEDRPDESLNLVATMMFAGFRSVVGTLWSILDDDAPIVADVFYRHLFRNGNDVPPDVRDAAYGLHLATQELRNQNKSLFSWVPYVHYGI